MENPRPEAAAGDAFFAALGPGWPLTARQRTRLGPPVAAALAAGWTPAALAAFAGANTGGVRSPYAVRAWPAIAAAALVRVLRPGHPAA